MDRREESALGEKEVDVLRERLELVLKAVFKLYEYNYDLAWEFLFSPQNLPENRSPMTDVLIGGEDGFNRVMRIINQLEFGLPT